MHKVADEIEENIPTTTEPGTLASVREKSPKYCKKFYIVDGKKKQIDSEASPFVITSMNKFNDRVAIMRWKMYYLLGYKYFEPAFAP
jgi:hypothetical protein